MGRSRSSSCIAQMATECCFCTGTTLQHGMVCVSQSIKAGRFLYSVPAQIRPAYYREITVVHPAIGMKMVKLTGGVDCNDWHLRLHAMWSVAVGWNEHHAAVGDGTACLLCNSVDATSVSDPVLTCPICLLRWHVECSKLVADACRAPMAEFTGELPNDMDVPAGLRARSCHLCSVAFP